MILSETERRNLVDALWLAVQTQFNDERKRFDEYGQSAKLGAWLHYLREMAPELSEAIVAYDVKAAHGAR